MKPPPILGAILAGGESRRFGSDKASAELVGRTLLDHAFATLRAVVADVVVAGGPRAGYENVVDHPRPGLGPLGGVCGALFHARERGFAAVLTMPCDTPALPPAALAALCAGTFGNGACYLDLPVVGLWPVTLADTLAAHLAGDDRSMRGWANRAGADLLTLPAPVANINRREDLSAIERATPSWHPAR